MNTPFPDLHTFVIVLSYLGVLLLLMVVRMVFVMRTNRRLVDQAEKLERQVLTQQREIIATRQDSNAWRGTLQVQFDTFRAESSRRLEDAELRYDQAIKQQERHFGELQATLAQALQKSQEPPVVAAPPPPPSPSLPAAPVTEMVLPKFEESSVPVAAE